MNEKETAFWFVRAFSILFIPLILDKFNQSLSIDSVNDFPAAQLCPDLASDLALPLWSAAESLAFQVILCRHSTIPIQVPKKDS